MAVVFAALRPHCLVTARKTLLKSVFRSPVVNGSRGIGNNSQSTFHKANVTGRSPTLKERLSAPEHGTAISFGRGVLFGASALGIGSLCYYGMGLASVPGTIEKSIIWPQFVRDRIKSTYAYLGGSVLITAISAMVFSNCTKMANLMSRYPFPVVGVSLVPAFGCLLVAVFLPYTGEFGRKQVAWMILTGIFGAFLGAACRFSGPLILRAVCYTTAVVGGHTAVAVCAPSEKFLYIGGTLGSVLGVMCAANFASIYLPPVTALGAGLYSLKIYGGLVLFGLFLLYHTKKIIRNAESHPRNAIEPYDPVMESLLIYFDGLNVFMRIAMLLTESYLENRKGSAKTIGKTYNIRVYV